MRLVAYVLCLAVLLLIVAGIIAGLRGIGAEPAEASLTDEILTTTLPAVREVEQQSDVVVEAAGDLQEAAVALTRREAELDEQQQKIADQWDELETARAELKRNQGELEAQRTKYEQLERELARVKGEMENQQTELTQRLEQNAGQAREELEKREQELETRAAELAAREQELHAQETALAERETEMTDAQKAAVEPVTARSAILFIGDGMGPGVVSAGRLFKGGPRASLSIDAFSHAGIARTYSSDNFVTDSAAAATALASGIKTYNGAIGVSDPKMDPAGRSRPVQKLTDIAVAAGKSVGIVTSTRVTHATPAAFYASVGNRGDETSIAAYVTTSSLSLLMGGGRAHFFPTAWTDTESTATGVRQDGRNLVAELQDQGWIYVQSAKELAALDPTAAGQRVLGLFDYDHMEYELERDGDVLGEPSLAEMVDFAIRMLERDPEGYFLMVEAARIDHAAHANQTRLVLGDFLALDEAVSTALGRAGEDTLIVVTADHDTGGLALNGYAPADQVSGEGILGNAYPESENPRGFLSWGSGPGANSPVTVPADSKDFQHRAAYPEVFGATHTGIDVPLAANGPGAARFTGYVENCLIPWRIAETLGTEFTDPANLENRQAWEKQVGQGS